MQFTISGKHIDITDAIREHAREKTAKLPRYYDSLKEVEVVMDQGEHASIEVEIIARDTHNRTFVGTEKGRDAYAAIDIAVHKLESQLRKTKGKEREDKHGGTARKIIVSREPEQQ